MDKTKNKQEDLVNEDSILTTNKAIINQNVIKKGILTIDSLENVSSFTKEKRGIFHPIEK